MDRILEIGGASAGYAGRLFVRAGAEVVRIEGVASEPAWVSEQAMAIYLHAGKRRVATQDVGLIGELAAASDVVIVDAPSADALAALGFDRWRAPVKASVTPFGATGPKRNWRATPSVLLAMGGYTYIMGDEDRAPLSLPGHYLEFQAGGLAYAATSACLYRRMNEPEREPERIDIGMFETVMALSQFTTVRWHCAGEIRTRHGSDFHFVVPSQLFRCADGWAYVNVVPQFWDPFMVFLDRPELSIDDRFTTNEARMANRDELHVLIGEALAGVTVADVEARAEACRIPVGVVRDFDQVLAEPHLDERDFWERQALQGEELKVPGVPYRFDGEPRPELTLRPAETR